MQPGELVGLLKSGTPPPPVPLTQPGVRSMSQEEEQRRRDEAVAEGDFDANGWATCGRALAGSDGGKALLELQEAGRQMGGSARDVTVLNRTREDGAAGQHVESASVGGPQLAIRR